MLHTMICIYIVYGKIKIFSLFWGATKQMINESENLSVINFSIIIIE